MSRLLTVGLSAGCAAVIALLLRLAVQEVRTTGELGQEIRAIAQADPHPALSQQDWLQVYNLAKAADNAPAFIAFLDRAGFPASDGSRLPAAQTKAVQPGPAKPESLASDGPPDSAQVPQPDKGLHPELTSEWAWKHARENVVIVTWTNLHFYDFVENWATHLSDIKNFLIGAMDPETADRLRASGFPYFAMFDQSANESALGSSDFGWGSGKFHQMGRMKIALLQQFLHFGLDIMLCDSDTVWINDPTDYFNRYPAADILTSSDHMWPTRHAGDDGLENPEAAHSAMNIGVMFFRHSQHTKDFVDKWVHWLDSDEKLWDQNAFNTLARQDFNPIKVHESDPGLFYGWKGRVVIGILPVSAFASGHTYHVQHLYQVMEVKPYVVHQTFQYGGTKGKRHRLREALLWHDPPEYYSGNRFLHAELDYLPVPDDFEKLDDFDMSNFHLQNMEHQLLQMREVFALAVLLNRTVVMPKLQCFCDRYWGPVSRCRLPGANKMPLPFVCPLDHIFEPFHFDDKPEMGPQISFREHSFLENDRTPESVKSDVLTVKLDAHAARGEVIVEDEFHWRIGGNASDVLALTAYDGVQAHVLRLEFDSQPTRRHSRFFLEPFLDNSLQEGFERRMDHMPGFWCCRQPSSPKGAGGSPYASMITGGGIEYRNR